MLVCIVLRVRNIDVAWLSRFLRFSVVGFDSSGGVAVHSHLIREKKILLFYVDRIFRVQKKIQILNQSPFYFKDQFLDDVNKNLLT